MALILCNPSDVASKIMEISLTVQSFRTDTIFILNIPQKNNSEKNGRVMVLVLCIFSDEAFYLFKCYENTDDCFKIIEWIQF